MKRLGTGTVVIRISVNGRGVKWILINVLHSPELGYKVLLVPNFNKSGLATSFHFKPCWISNGSELLATENMRGSMYKLNLDSNSETALLANTAELRHLCLAHIEPSTITEMAKSIAAQRLEIGSSNRSIKTCSSCVLGKDH